MIKKSIREMFDSWDIKSLLLTILFLSIGVVVYFYFTDIRDRFRIRDEERYNGKTKALIINVQKTDRIAQSKWTGTKIFVDNYNISYRYEVNGETFECVDIVSVTPKNKKLLAEIFKKGINNNCFVKFDTEYPKKSLLVAE